MYTYTVHIFPRTLIPFAHFHFHLNPLRPPPSPISANLLVGKERSNQSLNRSNPSSATHLFPRRPQGGDIRNRLEKSKEGGAPRRCPNFVTLLASSPPRDAGHPARLLSRRKGKDLNSRSIRNVPRRIFYRLHYLFATVFPKDQARKA